MIITVAIPKSASNRKPSHQAVRFFTRKTALNAPVIISAFGWSHVGCWRHHFGCEPFSQCSDIVFHFRIAFKLERFQQAVMVEDLFIYGLIENGYSVRKRRSWFYLQVDCIRIDCSMRKTETRQYEFRIVDGMNILSEISDGKWSGAQMKTILSISSPQ